jgi:hypothetical protein
MIRRPPSIADRKAREVRAAQKQQRETCAILARGRCQAETLEAGGWERCPWSGTVAAHIYPRRLCGKARDLVAVVIWTCRDHNDDHLHDGRNAIRAPLALTRAAFDAIAATTKEHRSLGPRP